MRRNLSVGLLAVAAIAAAMNARAKENGPTETKSLCEHAYVFQNGVASMLGLLQTKLVQKELGLTDAQNTKISLLLREVGKAYEKIDRDNPWPKEDGYPLELDNSKVIHHKDGSTTTPWKPHKPSAWELRVGEARKKANRDIQMRLETILRPSQRNRLWEIVIQSESFVQAGSELMGGLSDLDQELFGVLDVSEDQRNELTWIHEKLTNAAGDVLRGGRAGRGGIEELAKMPEAQGREELRRRARSLRPLIDKANQEIVAELTPKQRDSIAKMKGKEVDFVKLLENEIDEMADGIWKPTPPKKR
ncbi:MAG: hypothetical protein ABFC96_06565 [Thermoguttaceae bacterium]